MYYVLYVGTNNENKAEQLIRSLVPEDLYTACFHPVNHFRKKIRGKWMDCYKKMIPGYVFLRTDNIDKIYQILLSKKVFHNFLSDRDLSEGKVFQYLDTKEQKWLEFFLPKELKESTGESIVELSQVGFDVNDEAVITGGPLVNISGLVKKINLHKRTATVEISFMGRATEIEFGIELVEKKESSVNDV